MAACGAEVHQAVIQGADRGRFGRCGHAAGVLANKRLARLRYNQHGEGTGSGLQAVAMAGWTARCEWCGAVI